MKILKKNTLFITGAANGTVVRSPNAINYSIGRENFKKKYIIHNNVPYAEPVMMGTSLPPSWGGSYRSKNGLSAKHLDLLAKEITVEVDDLYRQIRGK